MCKYLTIGLIILGLILFNINNVYATFSRPNIHLQQTYRWDDRRDGADLYIQTLSLPFRYNFLKDKHSIKLNLFFQWRRNVERNLTQRKTFGLGLGKDFNRWLSLGADIQYSWYNEGFRDYGVFEKRSIPEGVLKLTLQKELIANGKFNMIGFVDNGIFFDLKNGREICNEISLGVIFPLGKNFQTQLDWLHIDRVPYYDSDAFEGSLTIKF
ncbi:MAG: hypothetical protein AB1629_00955 [Candidatus Omnitrophota bacterium]